MTREEKVAQLGSAWVFQLAEGDGSSRPGARPSCSAQRDRSHHADLGRELASTPEAAARARQRDPALPRRGDAARHPGDRPRGDLLRPDGARGDGLPAGDRAREHVGARRSPRRWPTRSACRCARSARTRASRPCSTSAAIRAGAAPRRRSARIRISSRAWASRSCAGCRATSLRDGVIATAEALRRLRRVGRRDELGACRHPAARAARGVPPSVRGRGARRPRRAR